MYLCLIRLIYVYEGPEAMIIVDMYSLLVHYIDGWMFNITASRSLSYA
ncbi:MAG: hypothetical protein ACKPKO_09050 [Candidatus Fonsibacter sp.]